jgi:DNA polymerase III delta prime subunit
MSYNYSQEKNKLLPWSEKYRPSSIESIIYHEKITKTIVNYLEVNKLPHLLFYGPPGTGKTSTILAIAKHYYKEDFHNMILVLNASEERGIETVRNRIKQFVTTYGLPENKNTPPFKLIILDEIDAMTEDAQAILRKVVEKYVNNVRFCFICNYLKKINPAIQSRCIIFRFKPIPEINMNKFITDICKKENIKINTNAIKLIIKRSNGDMRKLLNILQSIYMYIQSYNFQQTNSKILIDNSLIPDNNLIPDNGLIPDNNNDEKTYLVINENNVSKILSCPTNENIIKILKFIQENKLDKSYDYITNMVIIDGISLVELINCFYEYFMDRIINNNKSIIKYDNDKSFEIIKNMSMINENLSYCNNDNNQIISFISLFYL